MKALHYIYEFFYAVSIPLFFIIALLAAALMKLFNAYASHYGVYISTKCDFCSEEKEDEE